MTPHEFRNARFALGLSLAALAKVLRVGNAHVSSIEQWRRVPSETLCELLRAVVGGYRPDGYPLS